MPGLDRRFVPRASVAAVFALLALQIAAPTFAQQQVDLNRLLRIVETPKNKPAEESLKHLRKGEVVPAEQQDFCIKGLAWLADTSTLPATPSALSRDAWLLEDRRFVPLFGKPYDQMSADERATVQSWAGGCAKTPAAARPQAEVDVDFFARVFAPARFAPLSSEVQAIRAGREEVRVAVVTLRALAPGETGMNAYRQVAADAPRLRAYMSDYDVDAFDKTLKAAAARVAAGALNAVPTPGT